MVIRTRLRAILFPLILYAVSASTGGYFVWQAVNGQRGLKARQEYEVQMKHLDGELADLDSEKALWTHRVGMMQDNSIDADLLDEEVRSVLGRVDKDDIIVFDGASAYKYQ